MFGMNRKWCPGTTPGPPTNGYTGEGNDLKFVISWTGMQSAALRSVASTCAIAFVSQWRSISSSEYCVAIALAAAIAALSIYAIKEHHTLKDWPGIPDTTGGRDFARTQTGGDE
jgi:hypothetical protein